MDGEGRREVRLPPAPGASTTGWLVGAGLVGLGLLAVVTASSPVDVVSQPPPGRGTTPSLGRSMTSTLTTLPSTTAEPWTDLSGLPSLPPVVLSALQLVVVAALLWLGYLLARLIWRRMPRLRTRTVARQAMTPLPGVPDELLDTAAARASLLQQGTPRNAIVACWVDLEDAASSAGLPRRPAETSAEYTVRVLHTWDIAPDALGGLAELYREARYSRHALTEQHRQDAIDRLTAVHADLRRVAQELAAEAAVEEAARAARSVDSRPDAYRSGGRS